MGGAAGRCVAFMSLMRRTRMVRRIEEASSTSRTAVARMANPVTWSETSPASVRADQTATTAPSASAVAVEERWGLMPLGHHAPEWLSAIRLSSGRNLRPSRKSAVTYSGGIGWGW